MLQQLLDIPLLVTNPACATFILLFIYFYNHKERQSILVIFLFLCNSIAFNSILKYYFRVPLDLSLNNPCWYAFPSGHLQHGIVFWGMIWIKNNCKKNLFIYFTLALIVAGWATNYRQYHSVIEMIGAIPSAAVVLFAYYRLKDTSNLLKLSIFSAIFQCIILVIIESPCVKFKFNWLWFDLGLTLSIVILNYLWCRQALQSMSKLLAFCLTIFFSIALKLLLQNFTDSSIQFLIGLFFFITLQNTMKIYARYN